MQRQIIGGGRGRTARLGVIAGAMLWLAGASAAQPVLPDALAQKVEAEQGDSGGAAANEAGSDIVVRGRHDAFQAYLTGLRGQALASGVRAETYDAIIPSLRFLPRVIALDHSQPGGNPASNRPAPIANFAPYAENHVDALRISMGRRRFQGQRAFLAAVEAKTGVSAAIMMAIYGHETGYGSFTGRHDLIESLATLAFDGRRRALFSFELINALILIDRGVPRERLKGSWAGATGYPQFLPSVYLRYAVDGDGDGKADIWTSEADTLASIGNYLEQAGWKRGVPWGVAVRVPPSLDRGTIATRLVSPRCPRVLARHSRWQTIAEWRAMGISMVGNPVPDDGEFATLIEPDGPDKTGYLLTINYRAILDYNCSNFYALSVGLLADAIAN